MEVGGTAVAVSVAPAVNGINDATAATVNQANADCPPFKDIFIKARADILETTVACDAQIGAAEPASSRSRSNISGGDVGHGTVLTHAPPPQVSVTYERLMAAVDPALTAASEVPNSKRSATTNETALATIPASAASGGGHVDLQALAEACDRMRAAAQQRADAVRAMARELDYNKSNALFKAERTFESAMAALSERRTHVVDEIERAAAAKADSYCRRLAALSARLDELTAAHEAITLALAADAEAAAADSRALAAALHARLCGAGVDNPLDDASSESCHLDFDEATDTEMRRLMAHLGSVAVSDVSTELSTATGEGLRRCAVGKPTVVRVTLRNRDGAIVREDRCIEALIYKENLSVQPQIALNEHGSYDVVYIVPEPGAYTLSVGLHKQQIRGSPFKVKATGRSAAKSGRAGAGYVVSVNCKPSQPSAALAASDNQRRRPPERLRNGAAGGGCRSAPPTTSALGLAAGGVGGSRGCGASVSSSSSHGGASKTSVGSGCCGGGGGAVIGALAERSDGSGKSSSGSPAAWSDLVNVIGCNGRGAGELANPQGVCVGCDQGAVVVADSGNQTVQVFSRAGRLVRRLAERGRVGGQLLRPTGVAATRQGAYAVADYENKCVNLYSADFKFIRRLGQGRLLGPKGVAATPSGEIVVADNKANAVLVFSAAGKLLRRLGEGGGGSSSSGGGGGSAAAGSGTSSKEWQLAGPHYVACTPEGDLLVTDFHSHSVKCFNCEGQFVWSFGSNGNGNGQFDGPTGIAVDERGNIIVADWGNSRVQVFDRSGSFISHVNTEGSSLFGPQGVAVFGDGTVVVSDSGNHCVKLFKYS